MTKEAGKTKQRKQTDEELVKEFLSGKSGSFDKLVLKYKDIVFNTCFRILGDYDDAVDCAQDIFIKVYSNLKKFKFKSNFSTWLYRIAVNNCKNRLTSLDYRLKKRQVSIDAYSNRNDSKVKIEIKNGSSNPEKLYEKKERSEIIQKAIDTLPEKQKVLIVLRDIEGRPYDEIAEITGLKLGTVKSKLARARNILRENLTGAI